MSTKKNINSFCVKELKPSISTPPHQLPIFATSSFVFDNLDEGIEIFKKEKEGHSYSRYGNPTIDTVAQKIASLEGYNLDKQVFGFLTSSGMSAISTVCLAFLKSGDKVLTQNNLYGGTTELLHKTLHPLGVESILSDLKDYDVVESYLKSDPSIKLMYIESPSNPTMSIIDLQQISRLAQKHNVTTVIDNTFCTPLIQRPLEFGIDIVIHSTTKYLNGHGNSIAGAIIGSNLAHKTQIWTKLKLLGTNCNAWDAWLINNGIKTLGLRMKKHSFNALAIAQFLNTHPKIKKVNYNGLQDNPDHEIAKKQMDLFGGMLSFEIDGDLKQTIEFVNRLEYCTMAPTLGDVDTLVLHPATSSHLNVDPKIRKENGISDSLIRLSVGIEDVADIINDLQQALE